MSIRKKILAGITFFLAIGIVLPTYSVQAASEKKVTVANENITVEAEYGIDGEVYYDCPNMVRIAVESKENLLGTIRVIPETDDYTTKIAYGEEISLSAGEAKTFTMVPSILGTSGYVTIQILDENEKIIYEEKNTVTMEYAGNEVNVGVLSDDYSGVAYLDSTQAYLDGGEYGVGLRELTVDSFPEDSYALKTLQYLLIDNFDTASLSQKQYETLKKWVNEGGVLILSLGSNYQNVLHSFQDEFVTGTIGSLKKQENTWLGETVDSIEFSLDKGQALSDDIPIEYACQKEIGLGRVVVLSFSMGMEPMTSSFNNKKIAAEILEIAATEATMGKMYGDFHYSGMYRGEEIARLVDDSNTPSVSLYGTIFIVYIAFVGPILYLILKKKNHREKIWFAIPITALLFTVVVFLTGFIYRINKPIVNTMAVVSLTEKGKTETCYTNVVCPNPKIYNIQFAEGYTGFVSDVYDYDYYYMDSIAGTTDYDYWIKKNQKGTEVVFNNTKPFQETSFVMEKNSENNIGTIDCDITGSLMGMEGTITNNTCYDLKDVVISFEQYLCEVGDIKKGEQVTINPDSVFRSHGYSSFSYYANSLWGGDREKYISSTINAMMDEDMIRKDKANTGYIWGRVDSYVPAVVEGTKIDSNGIGVLMTSYRAEYTDIDGICCSDINMTIIDVTGEYYPEEGWVYETATVTYSLHDYPGVTELINLSNRQDMSDSYGDYAKVYAYNVKTGNYDQIFVDSDTVEIENYLQDDKLVIKFDCTNTFSGMAPVICAKGE